MPKNPLEEIKDTIRDFSLNPFDRTVVHDNRLGKIVEKTIPKPAPRSAGDPLITEQIVYSVGSSKHSEKSKNKSKTHDDRPKSRDDRPKSRDDRPKSGGDKLSSRDDKPSSRGDKLKSTQGSSQDKHARSSTSSKPQKHGSTYVIPASNSASPQLVEGSTPTPTVRSNPTLPGSVGSWVLKLTSDPPPETPGSNRSRRTD